MCKRRCTAETKANQSGKAPLNSTGTAVETEVKAGKEREAGDSQKSRARMGRLPRNPLTFEGVARCKLWISRKKASYTGISKKELIQVTQRNWKALIHLGR